MHRHIALLLVVSLGLFGCGDPYSTDAFPVLQIEVGDEAFSADETIEVSFGQAVQLPITKTITLLNVGGTALTFHSIGWATDDSGQKIQNDYVELDGLPLISDYPIVSPSNDTFGVTFSVRYSPPLANPLDDFSLSTIAVSSDARLSNGKPVSDDVLISLSMPQELPFPIVSPANYKFSNATPTKPETQTFRIENDPTVATAPFVVTGIAFAQVENEFTLLDVPPNGSVVPAPQDAAGVAPVTFNVRYQPIDEGDDTAVVVVQTTAGTINVPLSTGFLPGGYSLSFDHELKFDFTFESSAEIRCVNVYSEGPGPITIKEPQVTPNEALTNFAWSAFWPATSPDDAPVEITAGPWPKAMTQFKNMDVCVTYTPAPGGNDANGKLVIDYEAPENGEMVFDLFAGDPKPEMVLGPASGNVYVSASLVDPADTGVRHVFIYNEGNGGLSVSDMWIQDAFGQPADAWSLVSPLTETLVVPAQGIALVELAWDAGQVDPVKGDINETLNIVYYDPFTGSDVTEVMGLVVATRAGYDNPTATVAVDDDADLSVGASITLKAYDSLKGSFEIDPTGYLWNLVAKPAGSATRLNEEGTVTVDLVPDVAGTYTIELVVRSTGTDSTYLFSDATQFDLVIP